MMQLKISPREVKQSWLNLLCKLYLEVNYYMEIKGESMLRDSIVAPPPHKKKELNAQADPVIIGIPHMVDIVE